MLLPERCRLHRKDVAALRQANAAQLVCREAQWGPVLQMTNLPPLPASSHHPPRSRRQAFDSQLVMWWFMTIPFEYIWITIWITIFHKNHGHLIPYITHDHNHCLHTSLNTGLEFLDNEECQFRLELGAFIESSTRSMSPPKCAANFDRGRVLLTHMPGTWCDWGPSTTVASWSAIQILITTPRFGARSWIVAMPVQYVQYVQSRSSLDQA